MYELISRMSVTIAELEDLLKAEKMANFEGDMSGCFIIFVQLVVLRTYIFYPFSGNWKIIAMDMVNEARIGNIGNWIPSWHADKLYKQWRLDNMKSNLSTMYI